MESGSKTADAGVKKKIWPNKNYKTLLLAFTPLLTFFKFNESIEFPRYLGIEKSQRPHLCKYHSKSSSSKRIRQKVEFLHTLLGLSVPRTFKVWRVFDCFEAY